MSEVWPSTKVGDCCDILDNLRVPLNAEERDDIKGKIPYYGANGLQGYIDKFIFDEPLILLAEDGGYFDEYESRPIAYRVSGKSWVNNHAHILRTKVGGSFSQDFVFYCLEHKNITPFIKGGTRAKLNQAELREILIPKPPELIQRRIAEILSTVDEAIEQTEALIAKYQQIKAGLMHDLFTRGVTSDGHLRPTRAQAPHLYKDSPLGWIPKEWECLTIEDLLAKTFSPMRSGPFGSALLKDELIEDGIPFLGIDNVYAERFVPIYRRFISHQKFVELIRYAVFPGDVIITIMGTVGRCCVVPDYVTGALSSKHLWTMTFDDSRIFPELVCWQLNSARWVKDWFARYSQGAVMEAIQSSTLRSLQLPVPKIDEQELIVSRYRGCTHLIEMEETHVAKLQQEKHGLMHDLLTGRVRVNVAERASA
jgi:type I restriction enzyme S subunit